MLSGLDSDEATLARCRQVLTLWIAGLDTLSKEEEQPDWLPRVHPHSSGQCDLLLKGNPAALTEADEETYLRVVAFTTSSMTAPALPASAPPLYILSEFSVIRF